MNDQNFTVVLAALVGAAGTIAAPIIQVMLQHTKSRKLFIVSTMTCVQL